MLMQEPKPEMVEEWKEVWVEYKDKLLPNRKSGREVLEYLRSKYILEELNDDNANQIVMYNLLYNKPLAEKLPIGVEPSVVIFVIQNKDNGRFLYGNQDEIFRGNKVIVGVELESGFFYVEGSSLLWDELYAFQGLDENDIQNFFCVAGYISCLKKFGLLERVLC
ncbi:hypothetical protein SAMN02745163_02949 [Clostridium cavendishii DSM 21758]|uniref:Uncharacterized protein n=1 Tax=Clostridium cavendishii DSM 21758 TaxID=1121302 RepID=A0A1M6NMB0_9CLOT|nr:hypothetical protein [Clostridium cavendishii]SHJ96754.1 hypothetical protein SAMN02745163_02949 [Clostridium cavendishii DSM 21758]